MFKKQNNKFMKKKVSSSSSLFNETKQNIREGENISFKNTILVFPGYLESANSGSNLKIKFNDIEKKGYSYYRSILATNIPNFRVDSNESNPFYESRLSTTKSLEKIYEELQRKFSTIDKVLWVHILPDEYKAVITFEKPLNRKQALDLNDNKLFCSSLSKLNAKNSSVYCHKQIFLAQIPVDYDLETSFPKLNDECLLKILKYLNFYDHLSLFVLSRQTRKLIFRYYEMNSTLIINRNEINLKLMNISWSVLEIIGPFINKVIFEYNNCYDMGMEGLMHSILYYTKNVKQVKLKQQTNSHLYYLQYFIKEKKIFEKLNNLQFLQQLELIQFGYRGQELNDMDINNLVKNLPKLKIINLSGNENITGQHFYRFESLTDLNIENCYKILCSHMMEFLRLSSSNLDNLNIIGLSNLCGNAFWNYIQKYPLKLKILKFSIMPSLKLPRSLYKLVNLNVLTEVYIGNIKNENVKFSQDLVDILETFTSSKSIQRIEIDSTIQIPIQAFLFIVNLLKKDKIRKRETNKIQIKLGISLDEGFSLENDSIYRENWKNIRFVDLIAAEYTYDNDNENKFLSF